MSGWLAGVQGLLPKIRVETRGIEMSTVNMTVGDTIPFDVNSTIPAIPAGALTIDTNPSVHVVINPDNTGTIKALGQANPTTVVFRAAGYAAAFVNIAIAAAAPKPPVVVNFGAVIPAAD